MNDIYDFDCIVAGGGIAGSLAAASAGRMGLSVLLAEEQGALGGSMTSSGTGPMMTFHAGSTQVIRGITDELVRRLVKKGLSPGHTVDSTGYTYTVTPFDAEGFKRELELMCLEAGVTILYHSSIESVSLCAGRAESVSLLSCGKKLSARAPYFIDATGDGDLIFQAGVPYAEGRDSDGKDQPMTMNFRLSNVDIDSIRALMDKDASLFPFLKSKIGIQKKASRLSCSGFEDIMKDGIKKGEITFDRDIALFFETNTRDEVIVNMTRINGESPVDPFGISRAETEGRRQVWELYAFMKKHIPGFARAHLIASGPSVGVRSSRRMKGIYTITADDILSARRFDDAVVAFGYPIDIHSSDGAATDSRFLKDGEYYTIPYRTLINASVPNIMAAGRDISASFEAQASTRLSPCCGALGEAAGVAAAIAKRHGCLPIDVPTGELRAALEERGAFLG